MASLGLCLFIFLLENGFIFSLYLLYEMKNFSLLKFIFFNKTTHAFDSVLLRFYEQIISGLWFLSMLLPMESYLEVFLIEHESKVAHTFQFYFTFFLICTIVFILSSVLMPVIHQKVLRVEIQKLLRTNKINIHEKSQIISIIRDNLACRSFFSKEGFWQFAMSNIFNFGIISSYFGVESIIRVYLNDGSHYVIAIVFMGLFVSCMIIEWLLDIYLTKKFIVTDHTPSTGSKLDQQRELIIMIMRIVGRDSFRSVLSQVIMEDTINDIIEIMQVPYNKQNKS